MATETGITDHVVTVETDAEHIWRRCTCGLEGMRWPRYCRDERTQQQLIARLAESACPDDQTVDSLITLQMSWGGLFDGRPADGYQVHLARHVRSGGTPGPTLCDIDRFAKDAPGWSVGGGLFGPGIVHKPCPGCAEAAREQFPGLPVRGSVGGAEMAGYLGVAHVR